MATANPTWGAPRIHGELLKLGFDVAEATVSRFMPRHRKLPSQTAGWAAQQIINAFPWPNPYCERVIGSIRRECLKHVIVLGERHLHRILREYVSYYHTARTHLSLGKDAPDYRPVVASDNGDLVSVPMVGGLHHKYIRSAA
ncbi:MAG: integrase core domain-containing protein [Deltaproteobacteria bacterium]|nr:integrase core domain-containing protein [Deltaproteobacteria bacterium]